MTTPTWYSRRSRVRVRFTILVAADASETEPSLIAYRFYTLLCFANADHVIDTYVSEGDAPLVTRSELPSRHDSPAALYCWPGLALWARTGAMDLVLTRTCRGAAIHMAMMETRLMPIAHTNAGPYVPVAS